MSNPDDTVELLRNWYDGNDEALEKLVATNIDWMHRYVRHELRPASRQRFDSMDVVQDGLVRLLRFGPRFAPENRAQFRKLLARILVTAYRDRLDHQNAVKRDHRREQAFADGPPSRVDPRADSIDGPEAQAQQSELKAWVRHGLELLEPEDRRLIELKQFDGRSYAEIAEELDISSPDAARMRYHRATLKLAEKVRELQNALSSS